MTMNLIRISTFPSMGVPSLVVTDLPKETVITHSPHEKDWWYFYKRSAFTDQIHCATIYIPNMNPADISSKYMSWAHGRLLIQDAFPELDAEEREFIMTGVTPQEWNDAFTEEAEEEN